MHLLIDLDNTLLNTFFYDKNNHLHFYWSQDFKKDFGVSPKILSDLFCGDFITSMSQAADLHPFINKFLNRHKLNISADDFLEYWLSRDANFNPDVLSWLILQKKSGHHLHIASNQPEVRMNYILTRFSDQMSAFEHIFTPFRLGFAKPESQFFISARDILQTNFADICLIDDDIINIKAAASLGMSTILYQNTASLATFDTLNPKSNHS